MELKGVRGGEKTKSQRGEREGEGHKGAGQEGMGQGSQAEAGGRESG